MTVLRQWERLLRLLLRADNLNIAKPDPSLLVRGLNNLVSELWAKDKDATFRTQLAKSKLGVDVSPSWETALQLHQHLRAESENLVHGLPTTTRSGTTEPTRDPKLRPLQPSDPGPAKPPPTTTTTTTSTTPTGSAGASGVEKKCKWFTEPGGCRRGAACKFVHSFEGVSKKNRCYTCGARVICQPRALQRMMVEIQAIPRPRPSRRQRARRERLGLGSGAWGLGPHRQRMREPRMH